MIRASVPVEEFSNGDWTFDAARLAEKINAQAALARIVPHVQHLTLFKAPSGWRVGIRAEAGGRELISEGRIRSMVMKVIAPDETTPEPIIQPDAVSQGGAP
jgi:hypothetical protein